MKEAELTYKTAIQNKPDYWSGYSYLGAFYFRIGKYEDAVAQFQQVVTLNPNNAKGYRNLGSVYGILTRYNEALENFIKSVSIEPDFRTYNHIATLYYKTGKYKEAARAYEKVVEMQKNDYRAWGFLADTYNKIPDERQKADSANLQAVKLALVQLKINPNDLDVLSRLASYYGMLGDTLKAESILNKVELLNPSDVNIQMIIGQTYEECLGDRKNAIKWIKKAVSNGFSISNIESRAGLKNLLKDKRFITFTDSLNKSK